MAVVEVAPSHCPNGHPLGPGTVVVGWHPCQCVEGHAGPGLPKPVPVAATSSSATARGYAAMHLRVTKYRGPAKQ